MKTFEEDKEKYEKFKMDLQAKSNETEERVRSVLSQIESLQNQISDLKKQQQEYDSKMQKVEDEITLHKKHKKFLDLIAIASKNKDPKNQKQRKKMKLAAELEELKTNQPVQQKGSDMTFVTQSAAVTRPMPQTLKGKSQIVRARQAAISTMNGSPMSKHHSAMAGNVKNVTIEEEPTEVQTN